MKRSRFSEEQIIVAIIAAKKACTLVVGNTPTTNNVTATVFISAILSTSVGFLFLTFHPIIMYTLSNCVAAILYGILLRPSDEAIGIVNGILVYLLHLLFIALAWIGFIISIYTLIFGFKLIFE